MKRKNFKAEFMQWGGNEVGYETILIEKTEQIGIITMNRPGKLNAIDLATKRELYQALCELEADDDVHVIILTGAGRAFSSGHDNDDPVENMFEFVCLQEEEKLFHLDKPIIAAVHGYTLGDGMQQALLCDMIVASDDAVLGFIGPVVGGLCYGSFTVLPSIVGRNRANELLLTCERFSAQDGYRMGLINRVVPRENLMEAAMDMARKVAALPYQSIKYTKRALRTSLADDAHVRAVDEGWQAILAGRSQG
jgi:enoyl-CoA hydratase/carnithine racemase